MTLVANGGERCAYESGTLPGGAGWLLHPGGVALTAHSIEIAGLPPGSRILDLGCGSGESVEFLNGNGMDAVGIDHALAPLHRSICLEASAEKLPFEDSSFDGILAECSLSLMRDLRKVLAECARLLCPGGKLMISDLYARAPESIACVRELDTRCVAGMFVRTELEDQLRDAGFLPQCFEDHSRALREAAARYILEHDSSDGLWSSNAQSSEVQAINSAMKQVRAGYFLLVAARDPGRLKAKGESDGE